MIHRVASKELKEHKKIADILQLNFLFDSDIEICNYVIKHLFHTRSPLFEDSEIEEKEIISRCLQHFKTFSQDNYSRLYDIIKNTPIIRDEEDSNACVEIMYKQNFLRNTIIQDSGIITYYHIPKKLYPIHIYTINHENCHALKETNYHEHKDAFTIGETIPIFYELFSLDPNDPNTKKIIQSRLNNLCNDKHYYLTATKLYSKEPTYNQIINYDTQYYTNRSIYEFARSRAGVYLNSFYYAIILYHLYKQTPNKILHLVSQVLSKYITTYDMLTELDIYGEIKGEIFEKELHTLKKVLKK